MTSAVGDAAALTDLLAEHAGWVQGSTCICGVHVRYGSPAQVDQRHRAHVAEVLAGYVTTARAQAWDEGYAEGDSDQFVGVHPKTQNPYRRSTENTST